MRRIRFVVFSIIIAIGVLDATAPSADGAEVRSRRARGESRRDLGLRQRSGAPLTSTATVAESSAPCDPQQVSKYVTRPPDADLIHLLSRAAFGPTAQLLWQASCLGRDAWIDQQLHPELIADPELDVRLSVYPVLKMTQAELIENYPQRQAGEVRDPATMPAQIVREQVSALMVRAVHSRRQLEEVLVDFWFNHFNVYAADGPTPYAIVSYLRDAIRPRIFGRFEDLLLATAESPAMLYYLDNYLNVRPGTRGRNSGINENYARELLELHTVGVDGGYDQQDIIEVARVFTGWTIREPTGDETGFLFRPNSHDFGSKVVMGHPIEPRGVEEGREVIRFLAGLPATANFIATKLVSRLVADDPPQSLVRLASDEFLATGGDLRAVVETILKSDEFYDRRYRLAKVKSPFEVVASSLRAVDANILFGLGAARLVGTLGQPSLLSLPPTGYEEDANAVTSVGGMLSRFDTAYRIAANQVEGVEIDSAEWRHLNSGSLGAEKILLALLHDRAGADTRRALLLAQRRGADSVLLGAMALGSPEFQLQ